MSMKQVLSIRKNWAIGDAARDAGLTTPENITRFDNISYGPYGKDNLLDIYYLKGTEKPLPTIISIHGGGWVYGDKDLYQHYCMRLAQRGFTIVNFTYRLAPENKYPAALEDIFQVFLWIKENYQNYYIDYNNLFVVGDSAGGQLASQVCAILTNTNYQKQFNLTLPEEFKINAVGLNCGHYHFNLKFPLSLLMKNSLIADYLPGKISNYHDQLNVYKYITKNFPASFVMTSYEDFLKSQAKPMYQHLIKQGVEAEYHIYGAKGDKQIGHVFHVNCRLKEADKCNDEETNFFKKHMV